MKNGLYNSFPNRETPISRKSQADATIPEGTPGSDNLDYNHSTPTLTIGKTLRTTAVQRFVS